MGLAYICMSTQLSYLVPGVWSSQGSHIVSMTDIPENVDAQSAKIRTQSASVSTSTAAVDGASKWQPSLCKCHLKSIVRCV